eukprot:TRINITY_DN110418_c0_g1_i1.p1 TRINITY_DN110418_c0_g1~~TRINITY_DN110418_c0_g1_i1.p1  ORF type:complete len:271 (-),score=40.94 TRINITY_DN110418_c0_g1_i1:46-858(-)
MSFFSRLMGWGSKGSLSTFGKSYKLAARSPVARATHRFTFSLESADAVLGLPVGHHLEVRMPDGSGVGRAYTPVTGDSTLGSFDLVVKVYPNGLVGNYLDSLKVGDAAEMAGPFGELTYKGKGVFEIKDVFTETSRSVSCSKVGMVAGGTGITPMYQIAQYSAGHDEEALEMSLLFANCSPEDVMLREDLDALTSCSRFKVTYSVDEASAASWSGATGRVSKEILSQAFDLSGSNKPDLILICGPSGFHGAVKKLLTEELGFPKDDIFEF